LCLDCCKGVKIDNVKEICHAWNSDGLDLSGCVDVSVQNVFFRVFDDCVSVKAKHGKFVGNPRDIVVKNCIFWPDAAHAMLVGPEADPESDNIFENILFSNNIVLQQIEFSEVYQGVMAIFCADNATIRNVAFENITVDRMDVGRLISVIYTTEYATVVGQNVSNVRFENIIYNGNHFYSNRICGVDENHTIDGILVRNLVVNGKKETQEDNSFGETPFVRDLIVE
jgi:polygalacturonase